MIDSSSQKKKIVLIALLAVASVVAIGAFFRALFSSPPSSRQQFGLSSLSMTDENGDKWILNVAKGQSLSRFKDSSTKPGPPLLIKTDVQTQGREVSIGLIVEGQAGESYVGGAQKNGRWQPPPRFKIIDSAGNTLTTGSFKYG